jgi:Tfp pilus assembly protein PilN
MSSGQTMPPVTEPAPTPRAGGASFLPTEYVSKKRAQRAGSFTFALFCVVMFGVVAAFLVTTRRWRDIREQQSTINDLYQNEAIKIEQLKTLEAQRKQMIDKAEIVSALIERVPRSVLLAELVTRLPQGVVINTAELKSKRIEQVLSVPAEAGKVQKVGSITPGAAAGKAGGKPGEVLPQKVLPPKFEYRLVLQGIAGENNRIADYLQSLKGCELLRDVELQYIEEFSVEKVDMRKFEIVAGVRTDVDAAQIRALRKQEEAHQTAEVGPGPGSAGVPDR